MQLSEAIETIKAITGVAGSVDPALAHANANKASEQIPVQRDMTAGEIAKYLGLQMLPKEVSEAHINGWLHYHDLDYSPLFPMFNCFSADTTFITTEGNKAFSDFKDGDVIHVPNHLGNISEATVRCYGVQDTNEVVLKRGRTHKTVSVTPNHRWLLRDSTETTSLKVGDELLKAPDLTQGDYDALSWCLGFGDGTKMFNITKPEYYHWKVESIKPHCKEAVWCLEVKDGHSFLLQGGVVTGNCMLVDFKGMLGNSFHLGNAELDSPKSITTACAVTAQIIAQVASHTYGGTSFNRIDEVLAPYVTASYNKHFNKGLQVYERDEVKANEYAQELTEKECYDAFQGLEYEINTLHTANGQTPFCTLGFGLGESYEARLIQKCILKVRIDGLGKRHKTAVFPKLVFAIKKGLNFKKGDPNYDIKRLAVECATKRMYPKNF